MAITAKNFIKRKNRGWDAPLPIGDAQVNLVLAFGSAGALADVAAARELQTAFPDAVVVGCTTAGEIAGVEVLDEELVIAALGFAHSRIVAAVEEIASPADSKAVGARLAKKLSLAGLRHVIILSDGLNVNGSALVAGAVENLPKDISITGGLAADGARFEKTAIMFGSEVRSGIVVAIGFYGEQLGIGFGSVGGWDPFGPERLVTKSEGNKLFELEGAPALRLYKEYLGEHAQELPGSALLFPLTVRMDCNGDRKPVVRTVLAVNEAEQSITFAGDVPQGSVARFMKANVERLVDGSADAAGVATLGIQDSSVEFALLISCVGRRLVLKQRVEEEVEAAQEIVGPQAVLAGFYSYGEIAPFIKDAKCELHNQTMTITVFREGK